MVGRRCDGCHDVSDTHGWLWLFVSNTNYPNAGYWMRFHGSSCLRRWLDIEARRETPGDPPRSQLWLVQLWLGDENLARSDGHHRLRFPAHGAHFGRRGGA